MVHNYRAPATIPQVTSGSVQYCGDAARDRQTDTPHAKCNKRRTRECAGPSRSKAPYWQRLPAQYCSVCLQRPEAGRAQTQRVDTTSTQRSNSMPGCGFCRRQCLSAASFVTYWHCRIGLTYLHAFVCTKKQKKTSHKERGSLHGSSCPLVALSATAMLTPN